jgi:hypothetical protein
MALPTDDISAHVLSLAWKCLSETNRALKCPDFDFVFPAKSDMENVVYRSLHKFASSLIEMLQSPTPHTIADFKKLPLYVKIL